MLIYQYPGCSVSSERAGAELDVTKQTVTSGVINVVLMPAGAQHCEDGARADLTGSLGNTGSAAKLYTLY